MQTNKTKKVKVINEKTIIAALDIGKKSHYAYFRASNGKDIKPFPFCNYKEGFYKFWIKLFEFKRKHKLEDIVVGFESSGPYAEPVFHYLMKKPVKLVQINPMHSKRLKEPVALQVELTQGEQSRVWHETTNNLDAWGYGVKAYSHFERYNKADNAKARDLFQKAVQFDPDYAFAWMMLAWTHWVDARFGFSESRAASFNQAFELAQKALSLDDTLPDVYALLESVHLFQKQHEKAVALGKKAITLGPSNSEIYALFAMSLLYAGNFEEAIENFQNAMRLSPYYPTWYLSNLQNPITWQVVISNAVLQEQDVILCSQATLMQHTGIQTKKQGREDLHLLFSMLSKITLRTAGVSPWVKAFQPKAG